MRLTVSHTTHYRFDPPQARVIQSHRMTPTDNAGQRVIDWQVSVPHGVFGAEFTDGAGDRVRTLTVHGPVEEIEIAVTGTVETRDMAGVLKGHRQTIAPGVYLRKTRATAPGVGLVELSKRLGDPGPDALGDAHRMAELVTDTIAYTPGATHAEMTASEVVDLRHGVCQDHAQVLVAIARIRGVPARYVTGYLYSETEGEMYEASHAWAELHVPDLGWVGFDPANKCCPDERYIRIGSGLDALDAALIRGISLGAGHETMDISVNVAAQQ